MLHTLYTLWRNIYFDMTTRLLRRHPRVLLLNPNSSEDMTLGMERALRGMNLSDVSGYDTIRLSNVVNPGWFYSPAR